MSGLFVRKHADAVSAFCQVTVVYVHAGSQIRQQECVVHYYNKVREIIVYYPTGKGWKGKIKKPFAFLKAWRRGLKEVEGRPSLVHVNILTRTGIPALYMKLTKGIPYVITEHWSRYLPSRNSYHGVLRKLLTRLVVNQAAAVLPITGVLQEAMIGHGLKNKNYQVINNVVDDFFFEPATTVVREDARKHIVHISCFDDEPKNLSGIIRVLSRLITERDDFRVTIAGTGKDAPKIIALASSLNIPEDRLQFTGELIPEEIASLLHSADFFLLFSHNENAPVVISESLACGKPVVSSSVGGIPAMINNSNGVLVQPADEDGLKEALHYMLDHFKDYDALAIQKQAHEKYSYATVGKTIYELYRKVVP